jgi:hypothetical protein
LATVRIAAMSIQLNCDNNKGRIKNHASSKIHQWSKLNRLQLGRYAEYYVKMEFTLYGADVYTVEVDDKGIDFIIRKGKTKYYDIQVKSVRNFTYAFVRKEKGKLRENFFVALVLFSDGQLPNIYLIPSSVWRKPNDTFVSRDYKGLKSKPEWGINISKKNQFHLKQFLFNRIIKTL